MSRIPDPFRRRWAIRLFRRLLTYGARPFGPGSISFSSTAITEAGDTRIRCRTWLAASAMTASVTDSSTKADELGDIRGQVRLRAPPTMARALRRPWKRNAAMALLSPPDSQRRRQLSQVSQASSRIMAGVPTVFLNPLKRLLEAARVDSDAELGLDQRRQPARSDTSMQGPVVVDEAQHLRGDLVRPARSALRRDQLLQPACVERLDHAEAGRSGDPEPSRRLAPSMPSLVLLILKPQDGAIRWGRIDYKEEFGSIENPHQFPYIAKFVFRLGETTLVGATALRTPATHQPTKAEIDEPVKIDGRRLTSLEMRSCAAVPKESIGRIPRRNDRGRMGT